MTPDFPFAAPFAFGAIVVKSESVNPTQVRLFIKPYCGWCDRAIQWLEEHDVEFEEIDVISDEEAFDEMISLSGQDLAPVIDVDGEILADFGPRELAVFWKELEEKHAERLTR